jgi:hypothetical protein
MCMYTICMESAPVITPFASTTVTSYWLRGSLGVKASASMMIGQSISSRRTPPGAGCTVAVAVDATKEKGARSPGAASGGTTPVRQAGC